MSDRERKRKGVHASIGGSPADDVLGDLVAQFADRHAFVRELIQNSLDAGASRIDVVMRREKKRLVVEVIDDGEGMDRVTIEGYLLTLFRSNKEDDLTKIGKFGIGFVSLFAMEPERVEVDTGRDGIWHRVVFDKNQNYTLMEMEDPFEGTTVRMFLRAPNPLEVCEKIRASASRWCRYVDTEITTTADMKGGWAETPLSEPFTVASPVMVTEVADGFEAVVGISADPVVGFYSHGLTLWESKTALIPGVSFRVKGRHLEHTLSRDNVRRDRHFDDVMRRVGAIAKDALGEALHARLATADLEELESLFSAISHDHVWDWDLDAPIWPTATGERLSIRALRGGWLKRFWSKTPLYWAQPGSLLGTAVAETGPIVLEGTSESAAHLVYAAALRGTYLKGVEVGFVCTRPAEGGSIYEAAQGHGYQVLPASFHGDGSKRLAILRERGFEVETSFDTPPRGRTLLINVAHRTTTALSRLAPALGGPLLRRAALVDSGAVTAALSEKERAELWDV